MLRKISVKNVVTIIGFAVFAYTGSGNQLFAQKSEQPKPEMYLICSNGEKAGTSVTSGPTSTTPGVITPMTQCVQYTTSCSTKGVLSTTTTVLPLSACGISPLVPPIIISGPGVHRF